MDVDPFVDLLTSGGFQPEADIQQINGSIFVAVGFNLKSSDCNSVDEKIYIQQINRAIEIDVS